MPIYTPSSSDTRGEYRKMKLVYFSNEFPHDDLQDLCRRVHNHSKNKRHPVLARFVEEATLTIRDETRRLPVELKALIPPFETILDFADHPELRKGPLSGSIEGMLLCVVQLATFIGHHESRRHEYNSDSVKIFLAGLGIGLLASSAIALSTNLADIPSTGAGVLRVAFRLGLLVNDVSRNLQPRELTNSLDTWAYVIPEVTAADVQNELDAIQSRQIMPETSKVFISALSTNSVTVSGPPSRLKSIFRDWDYFRDRKFITLPVYGGLCHAKHVYGQQHVEAVILASSLGRLDPQYTPRIPVFSTSTGRPYSATTARELLEHVISELLTKAIEWDNVIQGVIKQAQHIDAPELQVLVFRNSLPVHDLLAALPSRLPDVEISTEDLMQWTVKKDADEGTPRGALQSKIAIVGMACRMPGGGTDTDKFWELLEQGLDIHRKIPADRFDVESHCDPTGKRLNTSHTSYGCFIDEAGMFDAPFFNMSPREAQQTDPMQRLALVTAYEALERAGYVANRTPATSLHRIGTFYGQACDDYREVNSAQEVSTYFIPGGCRAFGPGRINYFFKFSGPSFSIDTACSSSLAAIQAACTSLWSSDADTVVAGGMNVLTNSDGFAGLSSGHFLSKTANACKTWDSEADGYCRADGIGSIVMKRLEDAEADNDNILGVILAAATNHSAEAVSITHPHAGAQSFLYRSVMNKAGVDPLDVSYVEMHGTGTQAGDLTEIESITNVFAPVTKRRSQKQPLYIGAVKSNVGHGEAAAGVTALIKVLLMFQNNAIPPHVGIKSSINPGFPKDLDKRNLRIPYEKQQWSGSVEKKRVAVVNNFSAAGGNTTIAIEEAPIKERALVDPRSTHVIAVSAKSKVSLKGNLERLITYLEVNPDASLSDLSYSTTARRYHHNHRIAVPASDLAQVKKQLASYLESVNSHKPIPATGPPLIAFAFTGQGSSYKSMDLDLFHGSPYFHSQILNLDSLAQRQGFPSFVPAIDGSYQKDHSHTPVVTQLALVCTEIALAYYWGSLGVKPSVVIGHSLGEYAALHVAGVLSASDTIFLVGQRARLLEKKCEAGSHRMMAVRGSLDEIAQCAGGRPYEVACINGPKDVVLSGTRKQVDELSDVLQAGGYRCIGLDVAFAFHSEQTDPILDDFEDIAKTGVLFQTPNMPIISPLLSKVIFDNKTVTASYVRRATREPVNFQSALEMAQKLEIIDEKTVWVELGPHPVCMGFVKAACASLDVAVPSIRRGEDGWLTMAQSLSALHCVGVEISWADYHRPFEGGLRLIDLPTYSWNDRNYWIMYNGDWALTKGNDFYSAGKQIPSACVPKSNLRTSTVQQIVEEVIQEPKGRVVIQSDLMQPDFLAAAYGHKMNGCGVVTSSIHADIAYTLGKYLHSKLKPNAGNVAMNVINLEVRKGLVVQKSTSTPQSIQVSIATEDIHSGVADLRWHNVHGNGAVDEPFATANICYGDAAEWLASWVPTTHLVQGRIETLERLAEEGRANKFSHNMAYRLFASNLVNYADKYRGMQSVILNEFEAVADIVLSTDKSGTWTIPPFFIDSVAHLAGFIMNVSDAIDTEANFCVTPGWRSMRFARALIAGDKYRSYTKMIPTPEDPSIYLGDVYVLQDKTIIGMVGGIQFRRYPRILLNRFFSAPDEETSKSHAASKVPAPAPAPASAPPSEIAPTQELTSKEQMSDFSTNLTPAECVPTVVVNQADSTAAKAIALIAKEAALELADLQDEASFGSLGIDSLMSLVLAEKFREELGVSVGGGLFLEYPTIGDLRVWLEEYYS